MSLKVFLPLQFLGSFRRISTKYLIEFACDVIRFWAFVYWEFLFIYLFIFPGEWFIFIFLLCNIALVLPYINMNPPWQLQFQCLWFVWSYFYFFPGSVLGDCAFLRICPVLQVVHFIGIQLLIVVSFDPLHFCGVICNFFFFIFNFINLSAPPFFFLISSAKGLSILFIFSKNHLFLSLIFAIVFFVYCIYFCSDLYDFFTYTHFRLSITSHLPEWLSSKNPLRINSGEGVERRESSYTAGGNVNLHSHYEEQYGGSLKD